jgi:hypothetical protein
MLKSVAHDLTRTVVLMPAFRVVVALTLVAVGEEASSSNEVESQALAQSRPRAVVRLPRARLRNVVRNETDGYVALKTPSHCHRITMTARLRHVQRFILRTSIRNPRFHCRGQLFRIESSPQPAQDVVRTSRTLFDITRNERPPKSHSQQTLQCFLTTASTA